MPVRRQINRYAMKCYTNGNRYYRFNSWDSDFGANIYYMKKVAMKFDAQFKERADKFEEYEVIKIDGKYSVRKMDIRCSGE